VTGAIASGDHEPLHRDLLADAECRARIADALVSQNPAHQRS
jgi:hypothetical protein